MRPAAILRGTALAGTAVLALTALTGCATISATTTAVPVAVTTPATPGPITTAIPAVAKATSAAPTLKNTGTAWPTVIGSMLTYGQWLLANPNPALATTITEPGCASATALTAQLQSLVDSNAYIKPSAPVLTSIVGPYPSASTSGSTTSAASLGGRATVDVQAVRAAEPLIQRATTAKSATSAIRVLEDKAQLPPTVLRMDLILGTDRHWRFCSVTAPAGSPDVETISSLL